jgi:hypothetical protein
MPRPPYGYLNSPLVIVVMAIIVVAVIMIAIVVIVIVIITVIVLAVVVVAMNAGMMLIAPGVCPHMIVTAGMRLVPSMPVMLVLDLFVVRKTLLIPGVRLMAPKLVRVIDS